MTQAHVFTPDEMSRGGKRGAETRNRQALERARTGTFVHNIATEIETGSIGRKVYEVALRAATRIDQSLDDFPIDESIDVYRLGQVLEVLHKIYRLETGQSTSNAAHASIEPGQLDAQRVALLARLQPTDDGNAAS